MATQENINRMRVGTALIRQLSSTFYPNIRMIFDELVSNSWDAQSSFVQISIGGKKIVVLDDGQGMTKEQLIEFFYISYTKKADLDEKARTDMKRAIIGKFGIGKLSLYRICKAFEIVTWRDGKVHRAKFDFTEFEKNEFIDEFKLDVNTENEYLPPGSSKSGTMITLMELKEVDNILDEISLEKIKRDLIRAMPPSEKFKIIFINSETGEGGVIKPENLLANITRKSYPINDNLEGVGEIKGTITYLDNGIDDSGIYVRVFGRLVNFDNPDLIDFTDVTHARMFERKIVMDVNVNGLNDALQTNRSGFINDNPSYIKFKEWLEETIDNYNKLEYKIWEKIKDKLENIENPKTVTNFLRNVIESSENKTRIFPRIREFDIKVGKLEGSELSKFDKETKTIVVNSSHPMYIFAKKNGRLWGALFFTLITSMIEISMQNSKDLKGFMEIYEFLSNRGEEEFKSIKARRATKGKRQES